MISYIAFFVSVDLAARSTIGVKHFRVRTPQRFSHHSHTQRRSVYLTCHMLSHEIAVVPGFENHH